MQNDYIDFKFGDHWASEFNLLAVSSSDRYTPPVYGNVNPNIATIMGKKGVYKWKTQVNEKIFNINIAFDSVTIAQLNQIKQWLQPNKIQKLIFSEEPYKYYWAALNAEIDFSYLPFVEGEKQVGERTIIEGVYKGEMVISFVCIDNDGYSTEGTFEGLETENPSNTIKGNNFVLTDADNDYIEDLKIEGKSEQETKYNNTLSDTDFADVNSRSVEKAWKTNNLAQIQAKNGEVTISAPYQYSGIAQEQREALIDHKYFASAEINTDSLDTALEIAGKNITNSIEGKDINITDGLVGPVDDLVVSGDASQDKLYNNEINSSFLEDLDNWNGQNNGQISINKQKATVIANEKYDGVSQRTEENNVGDKYYVRAKVQSNNTETALEVETEKGSAEGSSITINDASDNKLENIRIEGKHFQEHYDQKDLGEGEVISYNNTDNYERYTKVSVSGNSVQEVIEEVLPTIVEGESVTAQDITLPKGRIGVYGNSKQETREGYNLLDINKGVISNDCTMTQISKSEYKITVNNNADWARIDIPISLLSTKTYRASIYTKVSNANARIEIGTYKDNTQYGSKLSNNSTDYKKQIIYNVKTNINRFVIWLNPDSVSEEFEVYIKELMLYEGSEEKEYEPYGAMPSVNYPSKIKCLGSNKNLLNDEIFKNVTIKNSSSISSLSNTNADLEHNGHYCARIYFTDGTYVTDNNFVLYGFNSNNQPVAIFNNTSINNINNVDEISYIKLIANSTGIETYKNKTIKEIKIEEVEENGMATSYSPYGQGSTKIKKINKNIMPINTNYYEFTENAIKNKSNSAGNKITEFKIKKGQTVKFGLFLYSKPTQSTTFTIYNNGGDSFESFANFQTYTLNVKFERTYTATEDTEIYIRMWGNADSEIFEFQLWAELDELTNYLKYEEQNYILDIQQEMLQGDYFVKEEDGWKEVHRHYKKIFDGTENIGLTSNGNSFSYTASNPYIKYNTDQTVVLNFWSNRYTKATWSDRNYSNLPNTISSYGNVIGMDKGELSTADEFKQKLTEWKNNNDPLVVFYPIGTPTKLSCTEEQSAVLDELNNLDLFRPVTNIITTEDIALLKLKYNHILPSPSPEVPSEIQNIRDSIKIKLSNQDGSKPKQINFPLSKGQKLMKGDYLARDGIHHVRKQIELNGTENWRMPATNEENAVFCNLQNTTIYDYASDYDVQLSSHFLWKGRKAGYQNALDTSGVGISTFIENNNKYVYFVVPLSIASTVEEWKTWLTEQKQKGTPVIMEYKLTKEEIELYIKTQQEVYNNLTHLIMYNGQNTLSSSNELKPQLKWEIPESPSPDYPIEINIVGQEDFKVNTSSNNFLDTNNINFSSSALGIKVKSNTDGSLKVSGTAIKDGYFAVQSQIEFFKPLKKGTRLTLNFGQNKKLLKDSRLKIFAWTYDKNNVTGGLLNLSSPNYSIILSRDVVKFTWGIEGFVQGTVYNDNIYITLNSEKEINNYIKNKQQISNIQCKKELLDGDYIDLKTNMEAHTWNYIELNGTEAWVSEPGNLVNTFRARVGTGKTSNNYVGKSTHFNFVRSYNLDEPHMYATDAGALYIYINKEIANSLEELKAWLAEQKEKGMPVRVYWKADKTSGIVLTSEQKIELQKLKSYREITNIISNDILQPNIKVEYIKKPSYTTKLTKNTEELLSLIYQTNIDKTKILLNNIGDNNNSFTFTHPILINLTKQFGSGKEPTKEWLDTNVDFWNVAEGGAPSIETSSRVKTVGSNINLFDPDNHIELDGQYRQWNTGNIAGSSEYFGLKIPVLGNTVYVVNSNLIDKGRYSNLCFYDKDFHFMWGRTFDDNNQVFRTPFNCRYITLALNKNYDWFTLTYGEVPIQKVDYNLANIDMQISGYDNQFKSFPLAKGQELLQLPNGTQDTLEADGIHKRVGKIIINGTENWLKQNGVNHEKTWRFIFSRTNGSLLAAKNNCYCDKFINYSADDLWNEDIEGIAVSKSQVIIRINSEKAESVVELKQLLQDNNLVLYLPKVSEEIIPYSNAQKAWYDNFEIYRKNTQITTIAETKPWYSFTYDINDTYSINSTKVNEYEKLGLIFNNLEDRPRFIVNRTADGSGIIKMRKPLVVDLTNAFGAGKEPDLAWCLENITFDNSCEYGTPSPNVPSELISVGSNPIKIENKSRNLIKEQNLLNWTKEYCTAERLTEKYDNRNIYRISFENHKKGTISTRIQQKKGNMVLSIYARVIQADDPTINRLVVAKVTSDSSASTVVSHKSFENLIGEWQKIYIPITAESIGDAAELVLEIQHNADTDDSTIIDLCMPQLEEGFTPHDYIPYAPEKVNNLTFTTPLRQLKNGVKDEFSKNGIIRRVGEHTIKSSDTVYWIVFNQDKDYITICGQLGIYVRGDSSWNAPSFYCNRIEDCTSLYRIAQAKNPAPSRTKEGIGIIDSEYRMCLRADLMGIVETDTEEDMIRKYKVLLDEKPFTIYYEKEVADIEPLTELQKNTLANLVTRKQYDHWLISGNLNPEVELSYKLTSSINDIHPWVTGSNLLDKTWFYNDNNIHTKPYVEVDTGDADKSGISATRPIYLLNSGTETANLSLTFDYINIETPLTIQTYSGKFTDDGFVEEAKVSEITIEPFTNYQPFKDIYDNNPANWKIEIDSTLGEVYLRHNTDETKVLNLNRFNKDHTFLSLADCNFVDYDKVFPTIISEIEGTAIENTIFNKVIIANTADNYRLKNVNVEWKHTYL